MAPKMEELPVRAQKSYSGAMRAGSEASSVGLGEGNATLAGRKRPAEVIDLGSEVEDSEEGEEEESEDEINREIKQSMRVVSDGSKAGKRPRVRVVVE